MKKIMILMAVVASAVAANAATIMWSATKGYLYEAGGESKVTSGSAYLMVLTAGYDQSDLVSAFVTAKGDSTATLAAMGASGAFAEGAGTIGSNSRITGGESTYAMTADASVYFVVFNGNNMFISDTVNASYDSVTGEASASFAAMSTSSKAAALDATKGYTSAGWYAVPEPTSGLLILVGLAGLALRRRRA